MPPTIGYTSQKAAIGMPQKLGFQYYNSTTTYTCFAGFRVSTNVITSAKELSLLPNKVSRWSPDPSILELFCWGGSISSAALPCSTEAYNEL